MNAMSLQRITLEPKLKALHSTFLERCAAISATVREAGAQPVNGLLVSQLRLRFLASLTSPTRSQLVEELALITTLSVVIDLVVQGWSFSQLSPSVILEFRPAASPEEEKSRLRRGHQIERDFQLREPSVQAFIRGMEKRRLTPKGWHSIFSLMRDGRELADKAGGVLATRNPESQIEEAARTVRPYLQFVEPHSLCPHTGLRLGDIWRYFRHTWSNTYRSIPGRSMTILVRDAAAPRHPVIGIAALGSSVVQQKTRDKWIGWDTNTILQRFADRPPRNSGRWLNNQLDRLIKGVYKKDLFDEQLLTGDGLRHPTVKLIESLRRESERAIKRHRLYPHAAKHKRAKALGNLSWGELAQTNLFRSKRTRLLSNLLSIRQVFADFKVSSCSPSQFRKAFEVPRFRTAVGQLMRLLKGERVGINMMDITVCGAIAPYNALLGGKLVCMLLCSPEVIREYRRRYAGQESVIASSMAGKSVRRDARLVLLSTTSLYGASLSQYSRVRIPVDAVGKKKEKTNVEYRGLGTSEGFGSFHFSAETLRLMEMLLGRSNRARKVNSIFGEGVNPLMRKIRDALAVLGLPGEELLKHGNKRVLYGVALAKNFGDVLIGLSDAPQYFFLMQNARVTTELIADYWRHRWLLNRLRKPGVLEEVGRHTCIYPIEHGAQVILPSDQEEPYQWQEAAV